MAVWQCGLHFTDGNGVRELAAPVLDAAAREFDKHLKRIKSWHGGISAWGDPSGDHIEVSRFSSGLGEIRIRIDMREIDEALLARIVETAKRLECQFLTADGQAVPAKAGKLLARMRLSPAQRFVEDPEAYFKEIAEAESAHPVDEGVDGHQGDHAEE